MKSQFKLNDVFNNPAMLTETGFLDGIVRGQSLTEAPAGDAEFTKDLINRLFEDEAEGEGGLDLTTNLSWSSSASEESSAVTGSRSGMSLAMDTASTSAVERRDVTGGNIVGAW